MYSNRLYIFIGFLFFISHVNAQNCDISIDGTVMDKGSGLPLSYVTIYIQELSDGTVTDEQGKFKMDNVCSGHYHFTFSHIGCEPQKYHFDILNDTILNVELSHSSASLETVKRLSPSVAITLVQDAASCRSHSLRSCLSHYPVVLAGANSSCAIRSKAPLPPTKANTD